MKRKIKRVASYKISFSEFKASLNYKQKGWENLMELANKRFQQSISFYI